MSNVTTSSNKEKSKIFETILSSPGMTEKCKIVLTISRQNILVLSRLIKMKSAHNSCIDVIGADTNVSTNICNSISFP